MDINLHEIDAALLDEQFFLEYHPIINLAENTCVGAEALIRWRRQGKIVPPMDFIPAIEDTPLGGLVTYWVLETVAHELGDWLRHTDNAFISINVPPMILGRGGLLYVASKCGLLDIIDKLVIEVTERGVPDHLGMKALNEGKKHRVRICLDDVGASNENLVVLVRANIDMIKLDKSFADQMLEPDWSPDAIKSVAVFTQSATMQVIAEGVEKQFQRDAFHAAGVQMAQGWYFSKPLPAEKFMGFFGANNNPS